MTVYEVGEDGGGRPSICLLRLPPYPLPQRLCGAKVAARGVCGGSFDGVRQNVAAKARAGQWDVRRWWRRRSLDLQGGQSGGSEEELR